MSTQGGNNSNNKGKLGSSASSSSLAEWFFGNQDKNTISKAIAIPGQGGSGGGGGGGGTNMCSNTPSNGFMSIAKNTSDWQSGRNANTWMPQSM